ncbi:MULTISPECIES: RAMP superfamily CRISPR-associated protein [unclassified Nostoc]|uniref:RAMP superfamily CRISPR-associated protein n=1 Tax=unclassified Nostoc TaxID=2593658 RepID=UPI000B959AFE|nr:RAMP superfamily CRISPR-associated protein [Nostoc sp. 'Peltigera membranacea cyanobiont' 232]OYE00525.1 CRISPR-associated protein Csm3 [Nostoc sp. 'Peltigera membranacea cyanobiont' 232]
MIYLRNLPQSQVTTIPLTAIIDSALCVGAGGSDGSLTDKPIVRNAKGQLLIPASQLKGRLRHECEKLARGLGWEIFESPKAETLCPTEEQLRERVNSQSLNFYQIDGYKGYHCLISQIFGNPILPSRIIVDDLICQIQKEDLPEVIRPGVTINRRRHTAEEKKLYFLETSPPNNQLEFIGNIHLLADCPAYAKALILAGLRHIHALGGSKSAGLGWLSWKELETLPKNDPAWTMLIPEMKS